MTGCPVENKVNGKPNREYPRALWIRMPEKTLQTSMAGGGTALGEDEP